MPLQTVEPRRLYRQIADQIAGLIAAGEFTPGSRLPAERELATLLGVCRASVREAIISLEIGGLVEVRVGTGIFVTAGPPPGAPGRDVGPGPFELLSARKLVEGEIAALAAVNASDADIEALRQTSAHGPARRRFRVREDSDRDFHLRLAKATATARSSWWSKDCGISAPNFGEGCKSTFTPQALARQTIRDHAAIVAAIAAHDPEAARAAMRRHLARVVQRIPAWPGRSGAGAENDNAQVRTAATALRRRHDRRNRK